MLAALAALGSDLRIAARALLRAPGFTLAAVGSLALGIGASAAAFAVIDAVRFRALPFPEGDRLVLISELPADSSAPAASALATQRNCRAACDVSYESFDQVLRPYPFKSLDAVFAFTGGAKALATKAEPLIVYGGVVTPNIFRLLDVRPLRGRTFSDDDNRLGAAPVTILSHALWTTQFGGDPNIVGRVVKLSDTQYSVIGVMPPGFDYEVGSKFWLPIVPVLDPSTRPSIRTVTAAGRLARGRTLAQLNAELATLQPAVPQGRPAGAPVPRMRLVAAPLRDRYVTSTQSHDLLFGAVVACVLLIACANLANLVLVRALHQRRELAIRAALGGGAGRITRHLLLQNFLLVALSALAGIAIASSSLGLLSATSALDAIRPTGMEFRLDARVIAFVLLLAFVAGALLSILPARLVARTDAQGVLRYAAPGGGGGRWGARVQRLFVVAQVGASVLLLVGGALMARGVMALARLDLGFDAQRVAQSMMSYPHSWRVPEKYLPVSDRIWRASQAIPGVERSALRATVPLAGRGEAPVVTLDGSATPLSPDVAPEAAIAVTPGYFDVIGTRVVRGRAFDDNDRDGGNPVAMINEWAARRWFPGEDPIGRMVRVDTAPSLAITISIVGVVQDNRAAAQNLLLSEPRAELYRPWLQSHSAFPSLVVRAVGLPAPLLRPLTDLLVREIPDRPVSVGLLAQQVDDQLLALRTNAMQVLAFAGVGLLLALLGVYGVLAWAVGMRTREIGIRGALGASRASLRGLVLRDAMGLTAIGVVLGLWGAFSTAPSLAPLLHGTAPRDPFVYVVVSVVVLFVSLLASWLPAVRASRVDPIVALRSD